MIKDIQDSGKLDRSILHRHETEVKSGKIAAGMSVRDVENRNIDQTGSAIPDIHAKIVSRLFWPTLHEEMYHVPTEIARLQDHYQHNFTELQPSRQLTWLPALGHAVVELHLDDRTFTDEVHTWQATVIWAFQTPADATTIRAITHSVSDLVDQLEMDESLVRSALNFWVSKLILHETPKDTYGVLESLSHLNSADRADAQAAAIEEEHAADEPALLGGEEQKEEKMMAYWQYVQGMLTNSAMSMPVAQIAMMLRMVVAEGFPYTDAELADFLTGAVERGELEVAGGKFKLKR